MFRQVTLCTFEAATKSNTKKKRTWFRLCKPWPQSECLLSLSVGSTDAKETDKVRFFLKQNVKPNVLSLFWTLNVELSAESELKRLCGFVAWHWTIQTPWRITIHLTSFPCYTLLSLRQPTRLCFVKSQNEKWSLSCWSLILITNVAVCFEDLKCTTAK